MTYQHDFVDSISNISEQVWDSLTSDHVFTSYAWLSALEKSGCVNKQTGWQPQHLVIKQHNHIIAILPGYIKTHSYGEYVFDWAFAEAYERYGLEYYPKWLCGVPFTPVQGPRLLCKHITPELIVYIEAALLELSEKGFSGIHLNFLSEHSHFANTALIPRRNVQFHWQNKGYQNFSDFLSALNARKRKMVSKERLKVQQQNLTIRWFSGDEINDALLDAFYLSYRLTYLKRSGHNGYLNRKFFALMIKSLPHAVRLCCAFKSDDIVATSLYFVSGNTLYGRYWGAIESQYDSLHFELCYYQGIELAIKEGLNNFDAGAQGEHKLARGFEPVWRHSYHSLFRPEFKIALQDYCERETQALQQYFTECEAKLPFKHE